MEEKEILYIFAVNECLEPEIHGPYESDEERIVAARKIRTEQGDEGNMFRLDVDPKNGPYAASFLNYEVEVDEDE